MKLILLSIAIIIFLIYTIPLIWAKISLGNVFGIIISIGLTLLSLLYDELTQAYQTELGKAIIIICISIAGLFFLSFFATLTKIVIATKKTATNEKAIIVLGCRVKGDVPTRALLSRCNAAYNHLVRNKDSIAILSGGQGADESISEAECMRRILMSKGIDKNRLFIEDESTSTEENFLFSKQLLDKIGYTDTVAVATNEYHIYRASLIAKKFNIKTTSLPGKSIKFLRIPAFTREVFGIWYLKIKG